jgi:hypothetical protein
MTTKEFLDRYDSASEAFTERELEDLWWNDLLDVNVVEVGEEEWGEPDRWNTCVTKVIQVENRYFMIYRYAGNTECQESYYDMQPEEVEPYEVTITAWRPLKNV